MAAICRRGRGVICKGIENVRSLSSAKISDFRPRGVIPATFTPFKSDGNVDFGKFPEYMQHMKDFGIKNLFVNGTTGEGLSMTVQERKDVAQAWMDGRSEFESIIMHIGTANMKDSQTLAEHCQEIGMDAIACIAPNYFKPQTEEQLVAYMAEVAKAAPELPFYLYDINFVSGIYLNNPRFFDLAKDRIPNLRGIKHSSPEIGSLTACYLHSDNRFHVLVGSDQLLLPSLALGLTESVPTTFMAPIFHRLTDAFCKGDLETARTEQYRTQKICSMRDRYGTGLAAFSLTRAMMKMIGVDLGPPRLPLTQPTVDVYTCLEADLREMGFFEWIKS